ncbi:hypothetical protein BDV32DRAFT_145258 [Aspergillus pseudonomiae]|uniref:Uncharacterized protein n=1 Tax=Aspergillus pseudonomiae TaxID=1506151 RepID=A0A5N7DKG9_9EURO|nr:uncharacterized protein BDV37DRAFT_281289 [Aspergillus pseudonomiae]KAB8264574.1 hypothetical protein BDV32DRAFT_145258 [Aspergillus pseudonomiae]KAE8406048.1 hypothetical protein BDV37DRAFT_281289 [Aspergillus pseudonomiae]
MPVALVDPTGDIVIMSGDDSFQVSSKILSTASPVFSVMFSPLFREGTLIIDEPKEPAVIHLGDDDAEALLAFFNIVHFRTDEIPEKPTAIFLERFAVLVDKYMCKKAVASQVKVWLLKNLRTLTVTELCPLLLLAYIMDIPERFATISKEILFNHVGSYSELLLLADHPLMDSNIVVEFERKRHELHRMVRKALICALDSLTALKTDESRYISLYTQKLQARGLLPGTDAFEAKSFRQVYWDASTLSTFHAQPCKLQGCVCMSNKALEHDRKTVRFLNNLKDAKVGICLDCLRSERSSFPDCRFTHPFSGDDKAIFTT